MSKKRFTLVIDEELNNILENQKWEDRKSKNALIEQILWQWAKENGKK